MTLRSTFRRVKHMGRVGVIIGAVLLTAASPRQAATVGAAVAGLLVALFAAAWVHAYIRREATGPRDDRDGDVR